jgi:hypothetical protein
MSDDIYVAFSDEKVVSKNYKQDEDITIWKKIVLGKFIVLPIVTIIVIILSGSILFLSSKKQPPKIIDSKNIKNFQASPTETENLIKGELICLQDDKILYKTDCQKALKTESGEIKKIQADEKIIKALDKISTGSAIVLKKDNQKTVKNQKEDIVFISSIKKIENNLIKSKVDYKKDDLDNPSSKIPTVTPTFSPTPTPWDPPNIIDIINNKDDLEGDNVEVIGYLINGNIGEEACTYMQQCDYSTIIVNQTPGIIRDFQYDVTAKMSISEKETDYVIGQKVKFTAKVLLENNEVILEKIY